MQFYENNTWYDQKGRIVFTKSRGKIGVGFPSKGSGFVKKENWVGRYLRYENWNCI